MAAARRYLEPVTGHSAHVAPDRVREDLALIDGYIDRAVEYVNMQDHQEWIDCLKINGDAYELTICPCHHPSIVCRAMDNEAAHNKTMNKQVQDMITSFKLKMGYNNFVIMNALRRLEEGVDTAQRAAAEVAEQASEVE